MLDDLDARLAAMSGEVRRAFVLDFDIEDYNQASELMKFFRKNNIYLGPYLIQKLEEQKQRILAEQSNNSL